MNVPLVVAGCLAVLGAAIHGVAGEVRVLSRLSLDVLPATAFGGPRTTKLMIHVAWHLTTIAFLTVAISLLLAGSVLHGDAAWAIGLVAASASTGFAAVAVGLTAAYTRSLRSLVRHPGPAPPHRHRGPGVVGSALMQSAARILALLIASPAPGAQERAITPESGWYGSAI